MQPVIPTHAEVVIVGGGFAGAATAYFLTQRGVSDVVVVEREPTCGVHASGRNAALGRQLPGDDRFADLAVRGAAFLRRPPLGFSDAPLLSSCGSILLAGTEARLAGLIERARARRLPHERLASEAVVERWPALAGTPMVGGVWFPTDGVIDIHTLLSGFVAGARAGGARVVTGCEVRGFDRAGDGAVRIDTTRGPIQARCAVVAAGAWAGSVGALAGAGGPAFDPVRRHLFVTTPVPGLDARAPFVWHLDDEFYVRPESGAYLISGCDQTVVEPGDPAPHPEALTELADKLGRVAPALSELGIARRWACLRTFTRGTRRPVIDWDPVVPWLFWTAGLGGHGATSSAAVGEESARKIAARLNDA